MFNTITAAGYLVTDPEVRDTKNNNKVCKMRMCISDNKAKDPCFIDVELWNKQAEIAGEYLKKGRRIIVTGELSQSNWEKDGAKHSKYFVRGENFKFINDEAKKEDKDGGESRPSAKKGASAPASSQDDNEDDIPF